MVNWGRRQRQTDDAGETVNELKGAVEDLQEEVAGLQTRVGQVSQDTGTVLDRIERKLEALAETLSYVRQDASSAHREARVAREAASAAQQDASAVRAMQEQALMPDQPEPAADGGGAQDGGGVEKLLGKAAGISRVKLICHRDTWAFIVEHASRGEHFRLPVKISDESGGVVEVKLSGRSLLAVVDELHAVRGSAERAATRQMAGLVYERIKDALEGVQSGSAGAKVTRIVIDDRSAPEQGQEKSQDTEAEGGDGAAAKTAAE